MAVTFWSKKNPNFEFSNFYGSHIDENFVLRISNNDWKSTEHYYQAMKFRHIDKKYFKFINYIRECSTPYKAFCLGKLKSGIWNSSRINDIIDLYKPLISIRSDWENIHDGIRVKEIVMLTALRAKFTLNEHLKKKLIGTGTAELVEASPRDSYWGRYKGYGKNRLGILLMQVRKELK